MGTICPRGHDIPYGYDISALPMLHHHSTKTKKERTHMNVNILTQGVKSSRTYRQLLCRFIELYDTGKPLPLLVEGVSDGMLYSLTYSLISDVTAHTGKPVLILTGEERRAGKLNEFFKKCSLVCPCASFFKPRYCA